MTKTPTKRKTTSKAKKQPTYAFTIEKAKRVLDAISEGTTVSGIAKKLGFPRKYIYQWKGEQEGRKFKWGGEEQDFKGHFARAKEMGFDAIADEAMDIADDFELVTVEETTESEKGFFRKTKSLDTTEQRKLKIWTRLQLLAKWSNRYSDKQKVELTGKDGGAIQSETKVVESMSTEELMRIAQMQTNEQGIDTGS